MVAPYMHCAGVAKWWTS